MRAIELTADVLREADGRFEVRCPKSSRKPAEASVEPVGLARLSAELEQALAASDSAG